MICPVCAHAQETGPECDRCGVRLGAVVQPPVAIERLPELETTRIPEPGGPPPPPAAVVDRSWVERTAADPVHATVEPVEVERTAGDGSPRARTPPAPHACRYCRTPADPGQRFCSSCGMRLASHRRAADERPRAAVRCRSCGTAAAGATCPGCGGRLPEPEGSMGAR